MASKWRRHWPSACAVAFNFRLESLIYLIPLVWALISKQKFLINTEQRICFGTTETKDSRHSTRCLLAQLVCVRKQRNPFRSNCCCLFVAFRVLFAYTQTRNLLPSLQHPYPYPLVNVVVVITRRWYSYLAPFFVRKDLTSWKGCRTCLSGRQHENLCKFLCFRK